MGRESPPGCSPSDFLGNQWALVCGSGLLHSLLPPVVLKDTWGLGPVFPFQFRSILHLLTLIPCFHVLGGVTWLNSTQPGGPRLGMKVFEKPLTPAAGFWVPW